MEKKIIFLKYTIKKIKINFFNLMTMTRQETTKDIKLNQKMSQFLV